MGRDPSPFLGPSPISKQLRHSLPFIGSVTWSSGGSLQRQRQQQQQQEQQQQQQQQPAGARGLAKSQFPVFTLFAQRTCLRGANAVAGAGAKAGGVTGRHWAFETVRGHVLRTSVRRHHRVASRRDCMQLCLDQRDFVCSTPCCGKDSPQLRSRMP
ncbi:hypothetical protein FOCC_FOCC013789 [Frankliniella occidentalis]|nr:hypothetical protein FOCC_FOCC013789 [Frankliniella occidentalis]